ncbi:VOC family protein [Cohnella kolymensis]
MMVAKLTPYISSEDARTQAEFYKDSLGGEILSVMTFGQVQGTTEANKDKIMHLVLSVAGGNEIFLSDSFVPVSGERSIAMALAYDTEDAAREAFTNLLEGGQVKFPFEQQAWGSYYGEAVDKFGVTWQIVKQM